MVDDFTVDGSRSPTGRVRQRPFRRAAVLCLLLTLSACDFESYSEPPDSRRLSVGESESDANENQVELAIRRGLAPGGDLLNELQELDIYTIESRQDARAVCQALALLPDDRFRGSEANSPLVPLAGLFECADDRDSPAFDQFNREGIPQLIRIFDTIFPVASEDEANDLLYVLRILALYRSREGAERTVAAALEPLCPDGYLWSDIFAEYIDDHPHRDLVFESLGRHLPRGFIAVALLDAANQEALEGAPARHPFDSDEGTARLASWLASEGRGSQSDAHSATVALPYIKHAAHDELLRTAREHVDPAVRIEAAWASAKVGQSVGLEMLVKYSLEVQHSAKAVRYLQELDAADAIPPAATEPDFQAQAEFADWLAHPSELGEPPDELEIVDKRVIAWPPAYHKIPLWVIRYRLYDTSGLEPDDVDCGMVGKDTFCFFGYRMNQRPPEDIYAIHCFRDLMEDGLIEELPVNEPAQYAGMLSQWRHAPLEEVEITNVVMLSTDLRYGQRRVAMGRGKLRGDRGWIVLDGPRSAWYPAAEMPEDQVDDTVLELHIGRRLLGFFGTSDRQKYLANKPVERTAEEIVTAYEQLLEIIATGPDQRRRELLTDWDSPLAVHLTRYAEAKQEVHGGPPSMETIVSVYQRFLQAVQAMTPNPREDPFGYNTPISEGFEAYVTALVQIGDAAALSAAVTLLEPHWDHVSGYGDLGAAAFKAGDHQTAERLLLKLRASYEDFPQAEEMGMLAEIWQQRGDGEQSRQLLIECMKRLMDEISASPDSNRALFEEWFQNHRRTYLRLFPDQDADLVQAGLPASLLN